MESRIVHENPSENVLAEVAPEENNHVKRITRYGVESRNSWLRRDPEIPRVTHPDMHYRKMICKKIEQITRTDHGTYNVLFRRDTDDVVFVILDCTTILSIQLNPDNPNTIIFTFEEYFTENQKLKLHQKFLNGTYDDLNVPEF
jgi:hypothetical protein